MTTLRMLLAHWPGSHQVRRPRRIQTMNRLVFLLLYLAVALAIAGTIETGGI